MSWMHVCHPPTTAAVQTSTVVIAGPLPSDLCRVLLEEALDGNISASLQSGADVL